MGNRNRSSEVEKMWFRYTKLKIKLDSDYKSLLRARYFLHCWNPCRWYEFQLWNSWTCIRSSFYFVLAEINNMSFLRTIDKDSNFLINTSNLKFLCLYHLPWPITHISSPFYRNWTAIELVYSIMDFSNRILLWRTSTDNIRIAQLYQTIKWCTESTSQANSHF